MSKTANMHSLSILVVPMIYKLREMVRNSKKEKDPNEAEY